MTSLVFHVIGKRPAWKQTLFLSNREHSRTNDHGQYLYRYRCVSYSQYPEGFLHRHTPSGTGSVRATLVREDGQILASSTQPTTTFRDKNDHRIFEQSTTEIWKGIGTVVQQCLADAKVEPASVKGLGFDATCSLAVSDENGHPVTVTKGKDIGKNGERNIILWADHRAEKEAEIINKSGSVVLNYVGGIMSVSVWISNDCF